MSTARRLLPAVAVTGSSIMVGCGGYSGPSCGSYGSYGSLGSFGAARGSGNARTRPTRVSRAARISGSPSPADSATACAAPAGFDGVYEGTITDTATRLATSVIAIIDSNGNGRVSGQDGTYYRLSVAQMGNNVSGSYFGYSQGAHFPNGGTFDAGSISAQVTAPGMNGTFTDQSGNTATLSLNFDSVYTLPSSLPTLVGAWTYSVNGFTLSATIQSDGTLSAIDSIGCTYSGGFSLINMNTNAYSVDYVRTCSGSNVTFSGLASYFPATTNAAQARIEMLADDNAGDYLAADFQ